MSPYRFAFTLSITLLPWLIGSTFAQTTGDEASADSVLLDEIIVTASKVPLPLRETAKPVQIIPREEIRRSAGRDLSQLLQAQAGIVVNGAFSNPGKDKNIYLRGANSEYTLILIDGQPVGDPTGLSGSFDLRFVPLEHIERIEILKGSQSTLYGPDAIAGVINIITRSSAADQPIGLYGSVSYGSLNTREGNVGLRGTVGGFGYNVHYQRYATDGISEATAPSDTLRFDRDGAERDAVQANFDIPVSPQIQLRPYFRYSAFDSEFDGGSFSDAANTNTLRLYNPGVQAEVDLESVVVRANYGYTRTARTFDTAFGENALDGLLHNSDVYVTAPLTDFLQLTGGVNHQRQQMLDTATVIIDPATDLISPYATVLFKGLAGFNAELGYRFNYHSAYGSNATFSVAPAYQITEQVRAFAAYTTGFKVPTLFQLYDIRFGNQTLQPQRSRTLEIGSEVLAGDNVTAQATYFRRHIRDVILFTPIGYINQDEQNGAGVELQAAWQIGGQWRISGQYTYLSGETTTPGSQEQDSTFSNLLRRPRHSLTAAVRYQPVPRLNLSVQAQYQSERSDLAFDPVTFAPSEVVLDGFILVNAHADYQLASSLTFFADLRNITNADYTEVYGFNTLDFNLQAGVQFRLLQ